MAKEARARFRRWSRAVLASTVVAVTVPVAFATSAHATTYTARINFEPATQAPIAGFTPDTGQAFSTARGYGWETIDTRAPLDMTGNTRWKAYKASTDARLSGMVQMQESAGSAGTLTPGLWEYTVPNGVYDVTVSTGDGGAGSTPGSLCCLNSVDRLTVEGVLAINNFTPTVTTPFASSTVTVAVKDGRLTIDPTGGVNTKINYVDIAPSTKTPQPVTPQITGVTPAPQSTQVALNTSVNLSVSDALDPSTVNGTNFIISGPTGAKVSGNYNTDAAGGAASFTPLGQSEPQHDLHGHGDHRPAQFLRGRLRAVHQHLHDRDLTAAVRSLRVQRRQLDAAGRRPGPHHRARRRPLRRHRDRADRALPARRGRHPRDARVDPAVGHPDHHGPGLRPRQPHPPLGDQQLLRLRQRPRALRAHLHAHRCSGTAILGRDRHRRRPDHRPAAVGP